MLGWVRYIQGPEVLLSRLIDDRGGIRGIVELEVLKAIEGQLPLNIPIRSFFDLIVGTRFVQLFRVWRSKHRKRVFVETSVSARLFSHLAF